MKVASSGIINGYFGNAFGHHGTQFLNEKKPNRSFPITWEDLPEQTKSLSIVFLDHDAIPVCGFSWIHWVVANIDPNLNGLPENASIEMPLLEGVTSWNSPIIPEDWRLSEEDATGFGGCTPPDKAHRYSIEVYSLDTILHLARGFYLNELLTAMTGHILDQATLYALYTPKV